MKHFRKEFRAWRQAVSLPYIFWFFVLFLLVLALPDRAADNGHDYGSQAAIEYWIKSKLAFGIDVIQNVGPYGFISYPSTYTGVLDTLKLIINIGITALFVYMVLSLSAGMAKTVRAILFVLVALFAYQDTFFYVLFWMIAYTLLHNDDRRKGLVFIATLALLAQAKGTFLTLSIFLIGVLVIRHALRKEYVRALVTVGIYVSAFTALWLAAGQSLTSIPEYLVAVLSFTSGYNEAMQIYEAPKTTLYGAALVLSMAAISLARMYDTHTSGVSSGISRGDSYLFFMVESLLLFVIWKHAYVRADGHVLVLVYYATIVSFISIWHLRSDLNASGVTHLAMRLVGFKVAATVLVLALAYADFRSLHLFSLKQHFAGRLNELENKISAIQHPMEYAAQLRQQLARNVDRMQTKLFKEAVGEERVSYVGMFPGSLVYNDFNYIPTPSTISFAAWNTAALQRNAEFFVNAKTRPKYVIFSAQTIDNRFVPQDDSLAKLELLNRYDPVLYQNDNALLSLNQSLSNHVLLTLEQTSSGIGHWIEVPRSEDPIWLAIDFDQSVASRIGALLYKPAAYTFEYKTSDGQVHKQRLLPRIAQVGFLVAPLISTSSEFVAVKLKREYQRYLRDESNALNRLVSFRINCGELEVICNKSYRAVFSKVTGLRLGNVESPRTTRLYASLLNVNADVVDYDAKYPVRTVNWDGKDVTLLHAPSRLVLRKESQDNKLKIEYGMLPTAYESGGRSDGIFFTITFRTAQRSIRLLQQRLDPARNSQDRGLKTMAIDLPAGAGDIVLNIDSIGDFQFDHFFLYKSSLGR